MKSNRCHYLGILDREATLKSNMVEPAYAVFAKLIDLLPFLETALRHTLDLINCQY